MVLRGNLAANVLSQDLGCEPFGPFHIVRVGASPFGRQECLLNTNPVFATNDEHYQG